ncbi:MAG: hypothetical protein DLM63_08255 [Solirubrobacterales bacterium]|nr:MAG: hypothetical protein DLM63_08255 [Solirubrobacterales bacterium]
MTDDIRADVGSRARVGMAAATASSGTLATRPPPASDAGATSGGRRPRRGWRRAAELLLAIVVAGAALQIAQRAGVRGISAVPPTAHALLAAVGYFALCGFAPVRLLLPPGLRDHELLWIVPTGACTSCLGLTVLGYAAVPFPLSLALVAVIAAAAGAVALRRAGPPARPRPARGVLWPAFVATLLCAVALVPMFRTGFATVIGDGSDSHLAVGTAQFLQHDYPTSVDPSQPVNSVPLVWRSKPPIYYGLAAVSSLSGMPTYRTIAQVQALLVALALLGLFVFTRSLLGASLAAALCAMGLVGLDRIVLHTAMHPYYNQNFGFAMMPWAIVLAWWALRERTRGGLVLLALFLALLGFAYPLALPIPLVFAGAASWQDRRERRGRGERVATLRSMLRRSYRGRRSLLWMLPLCVVLIVPIVGIVEKLQSAVGVVVDPTKPLTDWGGDLTGYFPEPWYFTLGRGPLWPLLLAAIVGLGALALRRLPRSLAWGVAALFVLGAVLELDFRLRTTGFYFEFKTLAFIAPVVLCCAAAALSRLGIAGVLVLVIWLNGATSIAASEIGVTFEQVGVNLLGLRAFSHDLPAGASIRLDVEPGGRQLWAAYMLAPHPLCSQEPLVNTSYPHVPVSRKADYIVVDMRPAGGQIARTTPPFDAVGSPLRSNGEFALYRENATVPGPDACSRLRVQTVRTITPGGAL